MRKKSPFGPSAWLTAAIISAMIGFVMGVGIYCALTGDAPRAAVYIGLAFFLVNFEIMMFYHFLGWGCGEMWWDIKEIKEEVKRAKEQQ